MKLKKYISRQSYIEKIRPFIDKPIIKVIVGQRRVGKSYLLYQLIDIIKAKDKNATIIYINKESYEFEHIKTFDNLINYVSEHLNPKTKNYLFIDEIQDITHFEKALRHLVLDENIDIYCTGSNANLLSGELATYLSGRYMEFKIYSLSYLEFLEFHRLTNNNENLKKYLFWGGLPFLKNLDADDKVIFEYLKNIYTTIVYKDIIARFQIRNVAFLENLIYYLANNVGNIISSKKISDYLKSQQIKMSPQIVLNYIKYLEQAFLIFKAKRKEIKGKKVFEVNEKLFFEDWGIMNAIVGYEAIDIGKVIENVIYMHLKMNDYQVFIGKMNDKEIDFVAEKNGSRIYIQACYLISSEKVKQREFGNLLAIKDNYPKYVVSLDEFATPNIEGIAHIHLKTFLSKQL